SRDDKNWDQYGYGQYGKPDAWKEWGKTKSELEAAKREEERMRIPDIDNFEPGTLKTHFAAVGQGVEETRRHGTSGGFVLPQRPPDVRVRLIPLSASYRITYVHNFNALFRRKSI